MPAAVLSDYEDAESVREAFDSAFRATTFETRVAVEAVCLVCVV